MNLTITTNKWPTNFVEYGNIFPHVTIQYRDRPDEEELVGRIIAFLEELAPAESTEGGTIRIDTT